MRYCVSLDAVRQGLQILADSFSLPDEHERIFFAKTAGEIILRAISSPCPLVSENHAAPGEQLIGCGENGGRDVQNKPLI